MSTMMKTILLVLAGVLGGATLTILITGFATNWFAPVAPAPATSGPSVLRSTTNQAVQFKEEPQFAAFRGPLGEMPASTPKVTVDDSLRYQKLMGFGAAITDSSAYNILQLSPAKQEEVLQQLFNRTHGVGMSFLRLPNSCSDFSLVNYTYDDVPVGQTDPDLTRFSMAEAEKYMIPIVKRIVAINPDVYLLLSPWSPPAWMKTMGRHTGLLVGTVNGTRSSLYADAYQPFANLWVKTIKAFWDQGIKVRGITLNNEPHYPPPDYPGLWMEVGEQVHLLNNFIVPTFEKELGGTIDIWAWDHNWDESDFCNQVFRNLSQAARKWVVGCAWHCYAGDVNNQAYFHNEFPDARTTQTECSGGGRWDHPPVSEAPFTDFVFPSNFVWDMKNLFINELNNWGEGSLKWNMVLNEQGGPRNNGCWDCRGVVTVNNVTKAVTYNVDYFAIGTMSKYFPAGAQRIAVTPSDTSLVTTAAITPDGDYVVVVLNQFSAPVTFALVWNSLYVIDIIEGDTAHVFKWKP